MSFAEDTVTLSVLPFVGSVITVNLLKSPFVPSLPNTIISSFKSVVSSPGIAPPPPAVPFKVITPSVALSPKILFTNPRWSINISFSSVIVVWKFPDKNTPPLITISITSAPFSMGSSAPLSLSLSTNRTVSPKTLVPISIPLVSESLIKLLPATVLIVCLALTIDSSVSFGWYFISIFLLVVTFLYNSPLTEPGASKSGFSLPTFPPPNKTEFSIKLTISPFTASVKL